MNEEKLILSKLDSLKELFEERFKYNERAHFAMTTHLEKINGAISLNRKEILKLKVWRGIITGGFAVIIFLIPIALSLS